MLRKEDSKKVLRGVKAIVFATSLSLLNPVSVEANQVVSQVVQEENDLSKQVGLVVFLFSGVTGVMISSNIMWIYNNILIKKHIDNIENLILDMADNELNYQENGNGVAENNKCLKLTNGLECR